MQKCTAHRIFANRTFPRNQHELRNNLIKNPKCHPRCALFSRCLLIHQVKVVSTKCHFWSRCDARLACHFWFCWPEVKLVCAKQLPVKVDTALRG